MQSEAEQIRKGIASLRARLAWRDRVALLAAGLGLAQLAFVLALVTASEWIAGRQALLVTLVVALSALPWFLRRLQRNRWGAVGAREVVARLVASGQLTPAQVSATELAFGRIAAGSDEAVALAIRGGATDLSGVEKEPLYDLGRRWVIGAAGLWFVTAVSAALTWPSASQRFLDQWSTGAQQAAAQRGLAQLRQLDFTLHYPAYLNRSPEQLLGSDGELEVPEGTEVELTVTPGLARSPEAAALLVDGVRVVLDVNEGGTLTGRFVARNSGTYRFALTVGGEEAVEREGHGLKVYPDQPPKVLRRFPEQPLELETAKEVEYLIEAQDDHGIASAELITRMEGSAEEIRRPIKLDRLGANIRHKGVLTLSELGMRPGDTLNWVVEMADNNNVTGPRTGRSRWHRIHLFDPSKRLDELLAQLDRFVESLTDRLAPLLLRSETAAAWVKATTVALKKGDKLAKQLGDRRLDAGDLERAVSMVVKRLTEATERYGAGQVTAAQMENRMERDLLFLDDLVSKRRLSQLNRLQQEVKRERAALQKLVERYRASADDEGLKEQIIASIRAIRRRLDELGKKMAKLEKRVGRQYINRDALEQRSVAKELDNLEAMVRQGKVEEALAALDAMSQALGQVEKQVKGASERFGGKEWREAAAKGKAIQDQMRMIRDQQEKLRAGVQRLRKEARNRQLERFGGLDQLRQKLQKLLAEARGSLSQMSGLGPWMKSRVDGVDERLQFVDKALAADGFMEALEVLRRSEGLLETLAFMIEEPKMKRHQRLAMERVGEAIALLERLLPDEDQLMNRAERQRLRSAQREQKAVGDRLEKLAEMMNELNEMAPMFGDEAMKAMGEASAASSAAGGALGQADAPGADQAQGRVLSALEGLEKQMQNGQGQGASGMPMPWGSGGPQGRSGQQPGGRDGRGRRSGDRVEIPDADEGVPGAWRDEIMDAWREGFAGPDKPAVDRYYRELVR